MDPLPLPGDVRLVLDDATPFDEEGRYRAALRASQMTGDDLDALAARVAGAVLETDDPDMPLVRVEGVLGCGWHVEPAVAHTPVGATMGDEALQLDLVVVPVSHAL